MQQPSSQLAARTWPWGWMAVAAAFVVAVIVLNELKTPSGGTPAGPTTDSTSVARTEPPAPVMFDSLVKVNTAAHLAKLSDTSFATTESLTSQAVRGSVDAARLARYTKLVGKERLRRNEIEQERELRGRGESIAALTSCKISSERGSKLARRHPDWDDDVLSAIACGGVRIGMTSEQAVASWGRPDHINRTTFSFGVHEQWVYGEYGNNYLYFEDGRLTTISN